MDKIAMTVEFLQAINAGFSRKEAIELVSSETECLRENCKRWVYNQLHQVKEGSFEQRVRTAATCLCYGCLNFDSLSDKEREGMLAYFEDIDEYFK